MTEGAAYFDGLLSGCECCRENISKHFPSQTNMPKTDTNTPAATVIGWLAVQLGSRALAPLTLVDKQAINASVEVVRLWAISGDAHEDQLLTAFGACVLAMQPHCREFAYHAIAHVCDWSTRGELWARAGLPQIAPAMRCKFE